MNVPWTHHHADVGDIRLHYVEMGTGPLVVLLHGFPDFWYAWKHQIPALAEAGFRVVAPDMRGYNLSSQPEDIEAYAMDHLVQDVRGLVEALGEERCFLAGHDWGAGVAWAVPMYYPELVEKLAILNVPHPARFKAGLRTPRQLAKSWYMGVFQLPGLPERVVAAGNFSILRRILKNEPVRRGTFSDDDVQTYVTAWKRSNRLRGGIHYYRAAVRHPQSTLRPIDIPVRIIWGERDVHLGAELAEPSERWVSDFDIVRIPDASHWVMHDAPERVSNALIEHFSS